MKNLANCTPVEFLVQTNKIRHVVEEWLDLTKVLEIRKHRADLLPLKDNATDKERIEVEEENNKRIREQAKKNISDMLDVALEENAEKTMEVIAMMCFVEKNDINNHKITAYLKEFGEMISDEDILDFFISLMRLGEKGIIGQSKR